MRGSKPSSRYSPGQFVHRIINFLRKERALANVSTAVSIYCFVYAMLLGSREITDASPDPKVCPDPDLTFAHLV